MEVMKSLQELVRPKHTALIVVDPQAVFCSAQSEFVRRQGIDTSRVEETVPRLNRFISACRQVGTMVVYTRQILSEATMLPSLRLYALDEQDRVWFCLENTPDADWYRKVEPPRKTSRSSPSALSTPSRTPSSICCSGTAASERC